MGLADKIQEHWVGLWKVAENLPCCTNAYIRTSIHTIFGLSIHDSDIVVAKKKRALKNYDTEDTSTTLREEGGAATFLSLPPRLTNYGFMPFLCADKRVRNSMRTGLLLILLRTMSDRTKAAHVAAKRQHNSWSATAGLVRLLQRP